MKKKYLTFILLMAGLAILFSGCNINIGGSSSVRGTGEMVTRSMDIGDFSAIDVGGNFIIVYRQSPAHALNVVMQENLFEHLEAETRGGTLQIDSRRSFDTTSANRPRLYIYAPYLTGVDLSGAVSATDWDTVEVQTFTLDISGAASVNIDLDVERLDIDLSGAASITLSGTANTIDIDGSGAFSVSAGNLLIDGGRVNASGAGTVTLSTLENVDVTTSGAARVRTAN